MLFRSELDETSSDYIAFYLNSDITNKLKTSPHAIHLLVETTAAGNANHGGMIEFKMMPAKSTGDRSLLYAYFDIKVTDNNKRIMAYCYLHYEDDKAYIYLSLNNLDGTIVNNYGDTFNSVLSSIERSGFGLGNLINVAIEPVNNSISVLSSEI